jgi:tetratricopeptide (TPR) repeat protein
MRITSALAATALLSLAAIAQDHPMDHTAPPPAIEAGIGTLHHPVTTSNADAQRYFDQGLRYVYAFNHEQAVASFQHASELDPDLAMAYWGAALALGPNINMDVDPAHEKQAYDAVQAALAHESHASEKERDTIAALAKRYSTDPGADLKQLSREYSGAMRALVAKYPNDLDLATLFAESLMDLHPWKLWSHDGTANEDTDEIVRTLESVLRREPNHVGANHYYIHAVEASNDPGRARKSAERLRTLAPAAGHLVHMPAHIFQRTGDYALAAEANAHGAERDREFAKKYGNESMYMAMYYNHNLDFGAASYAMVGNFAEAKKFADEMSANAAMVAAQIPPVEAFASASLKVLMRFGRWAEILKMPETAPGPLSTAFLHFARGLAYAHLGNVPGAERERTAFVAATAQLGDDPGFLQNSPKRLAAVAGALLDGTVADAAADHVAAIAAYRRAVAAEDALDYNEPADWFYPTRETLGAALLRSGDAAGAESVFRDDLRQHPKNPRALYGLAESLAAQKKPAAKERAAFRAAWEGGALQVAAW